MEETRFTKSQLKSSETFKEYTDILSAFLSEEESYTIEETREIINNFLKEGVD